jgi:hypothetical protein
VTFRNLSSNEQIDPNFKRKTHEDASENGSNLTRNVSIAHLCTIMNIRKMYIVVMSSFLLTSCSDLDTVSRSYVNLAQAREDIDKGWIPSILPASTYFINDSHDLDINIGHGTFRFNPTDIAALTNHTSVLPSNPKGVPSKEDLDGWSEKGFFISEYFEDDSIFVIAAHPNGTGRYWMALQR